MPVSTFDLYENFSDNEKQINYIANGAISYNVFKAISDRCCDIDEESNPVHKYSIKQKKTYYTNLIDYCEKIIKNNFIMKTTYHYSVCGRYYAKGAMNLQKLLNEFRGFICKNNMTDVDIKNSQPNIIRAICKKHNILCLTLDEYVKNRTDILEQNNLQKMDFIASMNFYKHNNKIDSGFYKEFDKEMKRIQQELCKIEEYKHIIETVNKSEKNYLGMIMNRIYFYKETEIILFLKDYLLNEHKININAYSYDGLMLEGNFYNDLELLKIINEKIRNEFNLDESFELTFKAHNDEIFIDPEWKKEPEFECYNIAFKRLSKEFEKTHCKIVNRNVYIKNVNDDILIMSESTINGAYKDVVCGYDKDGCPESFIKLWMNLNPYILKYDDVEIYANPEKCPKNIYNLWKPFNILKIPSKNNYDDIDFMTFKPNENIEFLLNHMRILCNNNENDYQYFLKWIAQMFQYPEKKTVAIYFVSGEGAGKGTLLHLLKKLMGEKKVFSTCDPVRDVFGQFNPLMKNAFLVNFNEVNKKDMEHSAGKLKALITEPIITISQKGIDPYDINSYHRCLITTNPSANGEEPVVTSKGSRRDVIIQCSDELTKKTDANLAYFEKIYNLMDDNDVVRDFYDYLMAIPNLDKFDKLQLPKTEYQKNITELSIPVHEQYFKYYALEHYKDEDRIKTLSSKDIYDEFLTWKSEKGVKCDINFLQFCVRLKNSKIEGIETKNGKKIQSKILNIDALIKYFDIKPEDVEEDEIKEEPKKEIKFIDNF